MKTLLILSVLFYQLIAFAQTIKPRRWENNCKESQVKGRAIALGVNFMFITNGNEIFQVFNNTDVVNIISDFPSGDEFHERLNNSL